ncbi:MAG: hypothetical protein ACRD03_01785 [Acidimicrobiales bacterium]
MGGAMGGPGPTSYKDAAIVELQLAVCDIARAIGGDLPAKVHDWLYHVCRVPGCDYIGDGHDDMVRHRLGHRAAERSGA